MNCRYSGAYIMAFYYLQSALIATYLRDNKSKRKDKEQPLYRVQSSAAAQDYICVYFFACQYKCIQSSQNRLKELAFRLLFIFSGILWNAITCHMDLVAPGI